MSTFVKPFHKDRRANPPLPDRPNYPLRPKPEIDLFAGKRTLSCPKLFSLILNPAPLDLVADIPSEAASGPSAEEMEAAPVIDIWQPILTPTDEFCLTGQVIGHPIFGTDPHWVVTSVLLLMDLRGGWSRTMSRYYQLGRLAEIRGQDMPPAVRFSRGCQTVEVDLIGPLLAGIAFPVRALGSE